MFLAEDIPVVTIPEMFTHLTTQQIVMLDGNTGPLSPAQEESLYHFVRHGGGLVCLGDAAEAYHEYELLGEVLGNIHGFCTPRSEIIARVATDDHYITRRVDPTFAVLEAVYLLDVIPPDAEILWRTSWRYASYTLAYTRTYGQGRVFCTTLGSATETQAAPVFQQMVDSSIRYVSGVNTRESTARVALIGYGAIGFEHGTAISN